MSGWILQKIAYDPAALNVREPESPLPRLGVVQVGSSRNVAVCGAPSPLVHVMTSPADASIVVGVNANPDMLAVTVPVSVDGAHAPPPAALGEAASLAGASLAGSLAGALAGASLGGVAGATEVAVPPPQAPRSRSVDAPSARIIGRDMWASSGWAFISGVSADGYVTSLGPVS